MSPSGWKVSSGKKKSPDIFLAPVFLSWCSDAFCKDLQVVLSLYKGILGRNCVTLFSLSSSKHICSISSVQSLSHVRLFSTPWAAAPQASLSITNSRTLLKLMSIESVMPSNHLILCHPFSSHLPSFPASGSFQIPYPATVLSVAGGCVFCTWAHCNCNSLSWACC